MLDAGDVWAIYFNIGNLRFRLRNNRTDEKKYLQWNSDM